jgi:uncharacterized iron-regulated membrane protein
MAGVTGSVIAFDKELDRWLNPDLYPSASPQDSDADYLSPAQLIERVEPADGRFHVAFIPLETPDHASVALRVVPRDGATRIDFNEVFVDRRTGEILGTRRYGACCFERRHVVPFLYELHRRLTLTGRTGEIVMGVVALVWLFDCFLGVYLTWPRRRPYLARWRKAWTIKRPAHRLRFIFDLHSVAGLWPWLLLVALALSSVYLNLRREVFEPVVSVLGSLTPTVYALRPTGPEGAASPSPFSFDEVLALAQAEVHRRGWQLRPNGIFYDREADFIGVDYDGPRPVGLGGPSLYFDGRDGRLIAVRNPGQGTAADLLVEAQFPIHSGDIGGLAGRIVICFAGIGVAVLAATGVILWAKRSRLFRSSAHRGGTSQQRAGSQNSAGFRRRIG